MKPRYIQTTRRYKKGLFKSHCKQFLFVKLTQKPLQLLSCFVKCFFSWFLFYSILVLKGVFWVSFTKKKSRWFLKGSLKKLVRYKNFFNLNLFFRHLSVSSAFLSRINDKSARRMESFSSRQKLHQATGAQLGACVHGMLSPFTIPIKK